MFDLLEAPEQIHLVQYFQETLQPSIKAELERFIKECKDLNELIQKMIAAKIKAQHRPSSLLKEVDQHCFKDNYPTIYKFQAQTGQRNMKDPRDSKAEETKP